MSIGLRDIAKGRATSAESRELILEIIEHHLDQSEFSLHQALLSRVFLIVRMGAEMQEIHEWYDILKATSAVLSRDFKEISIRIDSLALMLYRYICEIRAKENKPEHVETSTEDHAKFLIESAGWNADVLKFIEDSVLVVSVSSVVNLVSIQLESALPAKYVYDSVWLKIYTQKIVTNNQEKLGVFADWMKRETLLSHTNVEELVARIVAANLPTHLVNNLVNCMVEKIASSDWIPPGFALETVQDNAVYLTYPRVQPVFD